MEGQLCQAQKEKKRIIRAIANGQFREDEAVQEVLKEIAEKGESARSELEKIAIPLEKVPSTKRMIAAAQATQRYFADYYRDFGRLSDMSFEDKRKLIEHFFAGKDAEGMRLGVYVERSDKGQRRWKFTITGRLCQKTGWFPMSLGEVQARTGVETEFVGEDYDPFQGSLHSGKTRFALC